MSRFDQITIDVFDVTDPLNAFGLFSSDRASGKPVPVGAEGVQIGATGLNFWKGRYVVRLAIVERKDKQKRLKELGGVFSGALGGPMAALGPLMSENLGVQRVPIEVHEEGLRHSVRIGDAIDFEVEDVVPFGVDTGKPAKLTGIFHPASSELTVARATRSKINGFGISYEGRAAFSTTQFSWAA